MSEHSTPKSSVERVAELAKLTIDEKDTAQMEKDLNTVIEFADRLASVDTSDIEATQHIVKTKNVFKGDEPQSHASREELFANAKTKTQQYIYVPRVVEQQ